jgi:hypothetical protein
MINTIKKWIHSIKVHDNLISRIDEIGKRTNEYYRSLSEQKKVNEKQYQDNMMEAIETYQQEKYLKEHAQDFLMIMTKNAPEIAAQELFEYFELEVPDSKNIEIETAKKLYDLWCMAGSETAVFPDVEFEDLEEEQKQFFIQEVYKLWNR